MLSERCYCDLWLLDFAMPAVVAAAGKCLDAQWVVSAALGSLCCHCLVD
jgi:hypothetical protein